jgi:uncharacterized LabA/DUF88 family protein
MLKSMVFVDHMNFVMATQGLYYYYDEKVPKLDYNTVFKGIVEKFPNVEYLKTFIFAPKPDDFLIQDEYLCNYYKWIQGMKNSKYIDIVEGRYIAKPTREKSDMNIEDKTSYYKIEKGTDINLAVNVLTKAYNNSFDVAFILSTDTDYMSVYEQLKNIGKIVVLVFVAGQSIDKLKIYVDDFIMLDREFFSRHVRPDSKIIQVNS